jgi:glycosyltransferase involved in cell wall biosynthesis
MSTVSRVVEVESFLEHLDRQSYRDLELIVVDQNEDQRLSKIIERYANNLSIVHLSSERGLSRGRNEGLRHISGDVVGFPDDDCWYHAPNLLENVVELFSRNPQIDGVGVSVVDEREHPAYLRQPAKDLQIDRYNLWGAVISFSIFLRREVVRRVGKFDESLGVGASTPWGAGEEMDYMLRVLEHGFRISYVPALAVSHPAPATIFDDNSATRAHRYGMGGGRVLRMHKYPLWFAVRNWTRALFASALALSRGNIGKARTRWACFLGELRGWFSVAH